MSFQRHLCLALLLGLSSCTYLENKFGGMMSSSSKKSSGDKKIGEAKVIGVIEMVNPEQNYVLINCEQRVDIPAGTEIISQGVNGSDARLKVTPERKGNYITADITQGTPQLRDLVVYQVKAPEGAAPATGPMVAPNASPVSLTPIMRGDVPPPLDTPFQPMGTLQSVQGQIPAQTQSPSPVNQIPPSMLQPIPLPPKAPKSSQPADEPAADLSKLPPVIR
ncbi:hypothetical protein [Prosthecobacter sp.]|uniref:hypothetical protein n=1 Tax=Prosthecobacter sp. TaxID=1965333 RepID=UPI0037844080